MKEAGDDLGLSARQRRELSEQVETTLMTRALDQHFAKVPQEASSEQQEVDSGKQASEPEASAAELRSDSREQAQLEAALAARNLKRTLMLPVAEAATGPRWSPGARFPSDARQRPQLAE